MITIKDVPDIQIPHDWWVGEEASCYWCGRVARFDEGDRPSINNWGQDGYVEMDAWTDCPTEDCDGHIKTSKKFPFLDPVEVLNVANN